VFGKRGFDASLSGVLEILHACTIYLDCATVEVVLF
jgi:hypothetical protein